ncbi:MAG TPA: creatininase family protein [Caldilineae bacterium]|nr:creatininase family protein [Caldilineae bacterium]
MANDEVLMERMSWREIEEAIAGGKTTVILAVASIEQHGPHLPTGTDTYLGYALAEGIAHELGNALVAPVMRPGLSEHHLDFPGTVTLTQGTFMKVLEEYCISLAGHGFKDIVLISSHGGNSDTMVALLPRIAKALKDRCQVHMVIPNIREQPAEIEEIYREYGISRAQAGVHSGFAETSMMLALHPELVDMDKAEEGRADEAFYHPDRIKYSQIESFVYGVRSQSPNGILGDARSARPEAGRRLLDARIKQAVEEIRKMISVAQEEMKGTS